MDLAEIQEPTACSGCRYDLKGLPVDGLCPECATPVAKTVPACPRCRASYGRASALTKLTQHEAEVWHCRACGGHGFEREQLRKVVMHMPGGGMLAPTVHDATAQSPVACGRCARAMSQVVIDPATLVDRCEGCGMVWLDEAELEKVVRMVRLAIAGRVPPRNLDTLLGDADAITRESKLEHRRVGLRGAEDPIIWTIVLETIASLFGG